MENFHNHIRLRDLKARGTHTAFAIDGAEGSSKESTKPSFKGKEQETPTCVCGKSEWYNQCGYVRDDRPGRPSDFKADPAIAKKVAKALKDTKLKSKVEKSIKERREKEAKWREKKEAEKGKSTSSTKSKDIGSYTVMPASLPSTNLFKAHGSWIMAQVITSAITR
ncbi:MAG: hypothetical protein L6R42_005339 [Xanthoria sp. 1 TBL-2021]|nr:MAG: hypothetical protein L6R42_005339 [Xanthoria sp. 1 TBL-2021]